MASLAKCIETLEAAGTPVSAEDITRVKAIRKEMVADGMSNEEADGSALTALFKEMTGERKTLTTSIKKQGGDPYTRGARPTAAPEYKSLEAALKGDAKGHELLDHAIAESTSDAYKAIAERIRDFLPDNIEVVLVEEGKQFPRQLPKAITNSKALYWRYNGERILAVKGTSYEQNGVSPETILHELIHAATVERIEQGNLTANAKDNPQLAKASSDLFDLQKKVAKAYKKRLKEGSLTTDFETGNQIVAALSDPKELLAWGLTNRDTQEFLQSITVDGRSAWSQFVDVVRRTLGLPLSDTSALSELLQVTDMLLEAPAAPVNTSAVNRQEIDRAVGDAQTSPTNDMPDPTPGQIEAGNYKKAHVSINGLDISIENPRGSTRSSKPGASKKWSIKMKDHYGDIKGTKGADGDPIDVFIGADAKADPYRDNVFIIDQINPETGMFDEHKVIIGAKDADHARRIYSRNYAKGWQGGQSITVMPMDEFKTWLAGGTTTPVDTSIDVSPTQAFDTGKQPPKAAPPPKKPPQAEKKPPTPPKPGKVDFSAPTYDRWARFRKYMQDKFLPVKMVQAEVTQALGIEAMPDELNTHMAEERYYGATEEVLRVLKDDHVQALVDDITARKSSQEELDLYVYAKHAKERNEHIASINPDMQGVDIDGNPSDEHSGSGMHTDNAKAILAKADAEGKTDDLEALSTRVYAILELQRTALEKGGLLPNDAAEDLRTNYKFYIPLKGNALVDQDGSSVRKRGSGFDVRGTEGMAAMGRRTMAESPLAHSIIDTSSALERAERNKVANVFLKMVEAYPNPEYWEVFTPGQPDFKRGMKQIEGVKTVTAVKVSNWDKNTYFAVKRDGQQYYIKSTDTRLIHAMNNMEAESMNGVLRSLNKVTRFLSAMHTTYNPEFIITNISRDVQTAIYNIMAEQAIPGGKIKGEKLALQTTKGIPAAGRAIHASLHGKELKSDAAKEWQSYYDRFRAAGAQTGWIELKDFQDTQADLKNMLTQAQGGVKGNALKFGKGVKAYVHHMNTAVENSTRLAVFRSAIEAGVSEPKAASMAKNLTVNFNRKGEVGQVLNTAYMFANASIQGTATFGRAMTTMSRDADTGKRKLNPAQKLALGVTGGAIALAAANREAAGEDEDGVNWYDKIPNYVRERNIIIMKSMVGGPEGEYYTFPLPYGYNIFHVVGDQLESLMSGSKDIGSASASILGALAGSFSPIGINLDSDDWLKSTLTTSIPTLLTPVAQLAVNQNFYGSPITRENYVFGKQYPDSALGKPQTAQHWKAVTAWLNEATGGEQYISGGVDLNPDSLKFVAEYVGGGAGKFVFRTADAVAKAAQGQKLEPHEIPFRRRVEGRVRVFEDISKFYERRDEVGQYHLQLDSIDAAMPKAKFKRENKGLLELENPARATAKKLAHLRKRRQKLMADTKLPASVKDLRMKVIDREVKTAVAKFNRKYNEVVK